MTRLSQNRIATEILSARDALKAFDHCLRRLAPMLSATASMSGVPKANGRSRPRLSVKARATMVQQGRYIGYMRHLKPRQKAQVRKIREVRGVKEAIERARELARS